MYISTRGLKLALSLSLSLPHCFVDFTCCLEAVSCGIHMEQSWVGNVLCLLLWSSVISHLNMGIEFY